MVPDARCGPRWPCTACLNAPSGAGCSLTGRPRRRRMRAASLNAPSGAGCSLTRHWFHVRLYVRPCLNAPSGAGCSLTLPLGAAWLQRFQGLDRHRPCGALPAGGWSTPFLPPFVGMTPLATDGPRGGSGAGFGRDHAEKWQSDRVSRTTLIVANITSLASLKRGSQPRGHPHRHPSSHQIPGTNPSCATSWPSPPFGPP